MYKSAWCRQGAKQGQNRFRAYERHAKTRQSLQLLRNKTYEFMKLYAWLAV